MLKRKYAPRFFREHPVLTRTLGYAAFTPKYVCFPCPGKEKRSYLLKLRTNSCYPRCHLIYLPV